MNLLAQNGITAYRIILCRDASPSERRGAEELRRFLGEITGAQFPIRFPDEETSDCEIVVGVNARLKEIGFELDVSSLGKEGFLLKTLGKRLIVAGGNPRGTLYGVYSLLETLGCRFFTPSVSRIPKRAQLPLPELDKREVPALEYRDPFCVGNLDPDWHVRNKSNSMHVLFGDTEGYKVDYYPFVHTFDSLVPVAEYFDAHPEYFSEVDGVRIKERTQLCLCNPDVLRIATERVKGWIRSHPKVSIVSVSQNDWINPCTCPKCREIDEREESHAGTLITFVNAIAEAIEAEFPDVAIDTLAYQYTRKAPKYIRPRHNVIVRLCSIECCFAHPLSQCTHVASFSSRDWARSGFAEDLKNWSKVCKRLHIWDYTTNFAHYLSPFPDFKVLGPNIRFFLENHVTGIFEEGNAAKGTMCELNSLRQYLLSKLLWNADCDEDAVIGEFMVGVYGMAARPMREYLDLIQRQVAPLDVHMGIYDYPSASYLNEEMLNEADVLFDRAEALADDDAVLTRVKNARFSVRYVRLACMPLETPGREALVEEFLTEVQSAGILELREGHPFEESAALLREGRLADYNH